MENEKQHWRYTRNTVQTRDSKDRVAQDVGSRGVHGRDACAATRRAQLHPQPPPSPPSRACVRLPLLPLLYRPRRDHTIVVTIIMYRPCTMVQFHENFIPLWWNHKFQNLSRCATHNTPTSDAELFSNFRLVSSVYRTWEW